MRNIFFSSLLHTDAPHNECDGAEAVVFEVDIELRSEGAWGMDRELALVVEGLAGLDHNLIGMLRTEADRKPSALFEADNSAGSVSVVGDCVANRVIANGHVT
jgi:hypothetical protein